MKSFKDINRWIYKHYLQLLCIVIITSTLLLLWHMILSITTQDVIISLSWTTIMMSPLMWFIIISNYYLHINHGQVYHAESTQTILGVHQWRQRWCYVDACSETSSIAHAVLIDYLPVVGCIKGVMYLSSATSLHYLLILLVIHVFNWSFILGCTRMNIMHIVNCWWIPRIRMIHGLAYTQYWYAPCLSNNDVVFTTVKCDICAFRSCCSASNATKFFNSIDAVILHHVKDLIECSWEVSRCFIYGHSGIIIIIINMMMMIQLLKCIIET